MQALNPALGGFFSEIRLQIPNMALRPTPAIKKQGLSHRTPPNQAESAAKSPPYPLV